jgi:hypothetical protein
VYGLDLLGSAVGAFAVIPAIKTLGVEASALGVCAALLIGTLLVVPPRRLWIRLFAAATVLGLVFVGLERDRLFGMRPRAGSQLALSAPYGLEYLQWDPVARIEVARIPPPDPTIMLYPSLIGGNRAFHERFHRRMKQNDYAFTYLVAYDGVRSSLRGIEETMYAAAYDATSVKAPRVLVIGVGGGFDVLTGLFFGTSEITGVEINGAALDIVTRIYRDYCRPGVDSYSSTPAAAHVFSESYLYTAEAFDLYLSHLTDEGMLNMMRLEHTPPREMLRALTSVVEALRRAGASRPADHVMMLTAVDGHFTALLVKKTPFTEAERRRLTLWSNESPFFRVSATPGSTTSAATGIRPFCPWAAPTVSGRSSACIPSTCRPPATTGPSSSSTPTGGTSCPRTR